MTTESDVFEKLVLDFDEETKEELISVHPDLIKKLKPHQAHGVKFMWDSCFESIKQIEKGDGSGCILAHCMGLGKTLQVVTLIHTVLTHEKTGVKRILVVCPLSIVLNWVNELQIWLKDIDGGDDIEIFHLVKKLSNVQRAYYLNNWFKSGGVCIIGYDMFRNLVNIGVKVKKTISEIFREALLDPGPDLVVCDEGHMLKNEATAISKAMNEIKTQRRIVLTGTPIQNSLKEYHCMVQFVKPNLLGDRKEFLNRFVNPIVNGQFENSSSHDVRVMKRRSHVLHKMLDGTVQRMDYNVLTPFLPPKQEYVILVKLSDIQSDLYEHYLTNFCSQRAFGGGSSLFADYQVLRLIWTHPYVLKVSEARKEKDNDEDEEDDEAGSLKDFVVESSDEESNSNSSNSGSIQNVHNTSSESSKSICSNDNGQKESKDKCRLTRSRIKELGIDGKNIMKDEHKNKMQLNRFWWSSFVTEDHLEDMNNSSKLVLLFAVLRECEAIEDKLLVFSQSLPSLDMIEHFLDKIDSSPDESLNSSRLTGSWVLGADYFRLDGSTSTDHRANFCKHFNNPKNTRARLFLISTRAGGLGINLTAANRVIIFDASWNPSHDVQSIFRVYRFGQSKPCYVYRFISKGTMEEKIYERQVTKLSVSCRVVDEQQIDRHFNSSDLKELYMFNRNPPVSTETPTLPKDRLMAELLKEYKDLIVSYHEHDSLLENIVHETLTEDERKQAWDDYENEQKPIPAIATTSGMNLTMNTSNNIPAFSPLMFVPDFETILRTIKNGHPNVYASPEQTVSMIHTVINDIANTVNDTYYRQLTLLKQTVSMADNEKFINMIKLNNCRESSNRKLCVLRERLITHKRKVINM